MRIHLIDKQPEFSNEELVAAYEKKRGHCYFCGISHATSIACYRRNLKPAYDRQSGLVVVCPICESDLK